MASSNPFSLLFWLRVNWSVLEEDGTGCNETRRFDKWEENSTSHFQLPKPRLPYTVLYCMVYCMLISVCFQGSGTAGTRRHRTRLCLVAQASKAQGDTVSSSCSPDARDSTCLAELTLPIHWWPEGVGVVTEEGSGPPANVKPTKIPIQVSWGTLFTFFLNWGWTWRMEDAFVNTSLEEVIRLAFVSGLESSLELNEDLARRGLLMSSLY